MKTIALDMDEVIVDLLPHFYDAYEERTGRRLTEADLLDITEGRTPGGEDFTAVLNTKGFFRHLRPMPGALDALRVLRKHYRLYLVTAATQFPNSLEDKVAWIGEHLPWVHWRQIVLCGDKSIIRADYMLDDHANNLETFTGTPLLFDAWHNRREMRYPRMRDWGAVMSYFNDVDDDQ